MTVLPSPVASYAAPGAVRSRPWSSASPSGGRSAPEVERQLLADRPFVRQEAAAAAVDLPELELAHADAEAERIGQRVRRVERGVARNVNRPMKFAAVPCGSAPLRLHATAFRLWLPAIHVSVSSNVRSRIRSCA